MTGALQWLRTSGSGIAGEDGTPVRLRGVGIGGWLTMENFITWTGRSTRAPRPARA